MSDDGAYAALVREHSPTLARLAYQLTHDVGESEDLVQDVLLLTYRHWGQVSHADHPYAYLRRVMINRHLNSLRNRLRLARSVTAADLPDTAAPIHDMVERDAMWQALDELSPRQRAVLVLRYYERCDDGDIAAALGCRRSTVRSLAARGLTSLREVLTTLDAALDGAGPGAASRPHEKRPR